MNHGSFDEIRLDDEKFLEEESDESKYTANILAYFQNSKSSTFLPKKTTICIKLDAEITCDATIEHCKKILGAACKTVYFSGTLPLKKFCRYAWIIINSESLIESIERICQSLLSKKVS